MDITLHCHPETPGHRRELFYDLRGLMYPEFKVGSEEWVTHFEHHIAATVLLGLHYGWVQGLRRINREGGDDVTVVQDALIYKRWVSREAEERLKTAIPGVKRD